MLFTDRAILDGPARITREGHLLATARVARANNIQDYMPAEIGLPPKADGTPYRIFRPADQVFARDAVESAAHRPITIDHPAEDVSAANWKRLAVGDTGGEVLRDGEFLRLPIMVMDADGVKAASSTHQEFSLGYKAELDMTPGTFGDQAFDGSMKDIRINHLALCRAARGGAELRIVDERIITETKTMKIKIGDAEVDLSDGAAVALAVGALNTNLADALGRATTAETTVAAHVATIAAKDAEIVTLNQAVKDATLTPAQIVEAGKRFAKTVADAKRLAPAAAFTDAMDEPTVRKTAVLAKLGDAAKDFTDEQFSTAFTTSIALLGDADPNLTVRPIGDAQTIADADKAASDARAAMLDDLRNPKAAVA